MKRDSVYSSEVGLFDSFELRSKWWLPDAPDDRVPGTVTYSLGQYRILSCSRSTSAKDLFTVRDAAPFQDLALFAGVQSSFVGANFSAQMRAFFDCNFQHPIQLRETQGIVGQLGNLLSVLQGEPTYATQVRLRISASDDLPRTANVFWALRTTERPPITDSHDMNLSFRELGDDAACLFGSWFTNAKLFEPIYDVLVGTYGRQSERTKFRALAHALEGFHRAAYGGMYMSQESYKPIRKSLCAAIPADIEPDFQERLRAAIRYGFQYSLRTRLRVLLEKLTDRTKEAVLREKARGFIDLTVRVRNYLSHFDEREKPAIVDDAHGMYNLNQRLRALLIVLLLTYLCVPEDKVRDGVVSHLNLARSSLNEVAAGGEVRKMAKIVSGIGIIPTGPGLRGRFGPIGHVALVGFTSPVERQEFIECAPVNNCQRVQAPETRSRVSLFRWHASG